MAYTIKEMAERIAARRGFSAAGVELAHRRLRALEGRNAFPGSQRRGEGRTAAFEYDNVGLACAALYTELEAAGVASAHVALIGRALFAHDAGTAENKADIRASFPEVVRRVQAGERWWLEIQRIRVPGVETHHRAVFHFDVPGDGAFFAIKRQENRPEGAAPIAGTVMQTFFQLDTLWAGILPEQVQG
ncbi:hypothetical protein VQH23_12940 [Pararoseomonas sp. SCSIO 73927]|uniref:hypothetical protein n=1 Tax=Pararoseomonas sp. SCSIO 73927 TaxID=3114537 RepID=UPI0030D2EF72